MKTSRVILIGLLATALSACGFHLREAASLPKSIETVRLVPGSDELAQALAVALEDGGARITEDPKGADATVRVNTNTFTQRLLSVDPNTGRAREYELEYRVRFRVDGRDRESLLPSQTLTLVRDYIFDADQVIGKSRESSVLREEMRRDAAQQMLRRIHAALR